MQGRQNSAATGDKKKCRMEESDSNTIGQIVNS